MQNCFKEGYGWLQLYIFQISQNGCHQKENGGPQAARNLYILKYLYLAGKIGENTTESLYYFTLEDYPTEGYSFLFIYFIDNFT